MIVSPYVSKLTTAFMSFQGTDGCIFQETKGEERSWRNGLLGCSLLRPSDLHMLYELSTFLSKVLKDYTVIMFTQHIVLMGLKVCTLYQRLQNVHMQQTPKNLNKK